MEHVSGRPLDQISARLSRDQIGRYGTQIARALDHAHKHHVVHRDLKSSNIMITADGDAVVLDFGIAAQVADEGQTRRHRGHRGNSLIARSGALF